ncbi:hypothetical protein GF1_09360 [Desulfolithobacter dissulfuricans]|uniref:Response regulatory domain-containing protein n=1 Tax=Desulfolithobacter dissulfuricans TaxID=2795293 RepID=A0A915XHX9_9BACT|nr:hypothetical protein [Desulfolithobacter dissulfuricans]BCO08560.1 hypothetical protein GF1_09360 [Desulfolithobacter dissulfuricans]
MKARDRLDRIIEACRERIQTEVSVLLGKQLTLAKAETDILTKEDFFSMPAGKMVLAHIQMEGDIEGQGALLVLLKDAIRIGGTLIMLPESELETVIAEESYTEELEDSYGEIANIIAGALTSTFEELYPKNFRLVRTEQEIIIPVKVDVESDKPIPDDTYYLMTSALRLDEVEMGDMHLLLPAAPFGLVESETEAEPAEQQAAPAAQAGSATATETEAGEDIEVIRNQDASTEEESVEVIRQESSDDGEAGTSPAAPPPKKTDPRKQKKLIDRLLDGCRQQMEVEVGALLDGKLKLTPEGNALVTKEDFLDQLGSNQVMARLAVRGEKEGEAYIFASLKDAVFLGGTLIMLPEGELGEAVLREEFGPDVEDAYGEIANIIAGVYTSVFEEQYRKKIGFVKTSLDKIVPVKIDPDSDDTFPNTLYYLSVLSLSFDDRELGQLQVLFPADLLDLQDLGQTEKEQQATGTTSQGSRAVSADGGDAGAPFSAAASRTAETDGGAGGPARGQAVDQAADVPDILICTDHEEEGERIAGVLRNMGHQPRILHFKDPVANYLPGAIGCVFLVMRSVSEQGFGVAIKIHTTAPSIPLIAAGPAWTRTTVLKAVKYGAVDILITPASEEDIREKIEANLGQKAA